jgi:hypothetical protein
MSTFIEVIKEHIGYKQQIVKLAKSDVIRTYRGAALRMALGDYKAGYYNFCLLVCIYDRVKRRKTC